jgi:hypothetical protein
MEIAKIVFVSWSTEIPMGISASTLGIWGSSGKLSRDIPAMRVLDAHTAS